MPVYKREKMNYGMKYLSDNYGPILEKAGIDLMLSGHTHSVAYLDSEKSGFGYPVVVGSNNTFIEVTSTNNMIRVVLKDVKGNTINDINIKRK